MCRQGKALLVKSNLHQDLPAKEPLRPIESEERAKQGPVREDPPARWD